MKIRDLEFEADLIVRQVAEMLYAGYAYMSPAAWPNVKAALDEIEESFGPGSISIVALEDGCARGFAGAIRQYSGHSWELHLLAVHPNYRDSLIGEALVREVENRVRDSGAITLWLSTDDESGLTSLFGEDLYPDPLKKTSLIRDIGGHPFSFFERMGFKVCGVIPDANGLGKPDILLAKRLRKIN